MERKWKEITQLYFKKIKILGDICKKIVLLITLMTLI